jgi:hypothetical protein
LIALSRVAMIVLLEHRPDFARQRIAAGAPGIFTVQMPAARVVDDVTPDGIQGTFMANDVFVIIALPDRCAGGAAYCVDAFGDGGFERSQDGRDGSGNGFAELFRDINIGCGGG